jgi:hypothetical protein
MIRRSLRFASTAAIVLTLVAMTAGVASADGNKTKTTYDSVPRNLPGNVISWAFQATQTSEFGDSVALAAGPRRADSVDVVMSSWGCQTGTWNGGDCVTRHHARFSHPITLNLYNVDPTTGEPGALVLSKTQVFAIPFRPSADPVKCTGDNAGKWYDREDKTCYNGLATKITFKLNGTVLPTNVIWTVAFNTTSYGSAPIGTAAACFTTAAGCGYDALNVGIESFVGQPSKGTDVDPDGAMLNSITPSNYCDGGTVTGTLRLDTGPPSPCWTGYTPLATIRTR